MARKQKQKKIQQKFPIDHPVTATLNIKKITSILLILFLIINLYLYATRKVAPLYFWGILLFVGIFAFFVLPKL